VDELIMANQIPSGRTLDTDFMFTKLFVSDLEKSGEFYASVFGLVEMHRVEAAIAGRPVTELVYMPTYPGGPMFILARFHDVSTAAGDELILGFATQDLEALLERVEKAGGRIVEPVQEIPQAGMRLAFVADAEGHVSQVTQMIG